MRRLLFIFSVVLMAGVTPAQLTTYTVSNTGFWNDAANWDQPVAPINDPNAKINGKSKKTITLTNTATIAYLALNDGDATTLSVVIDGGALNSVANNWNAIGYDKSASMLITNGGSWSCTGRIDVGLLDGVNGQQNVFTMADNSGDVYVSGDFSLGRSFDGSHAATTRAYIHGGTLSVGGNFTIASAGDNLLDMDGDAILIIAGDEASKVQGYVRDGKVTAFGGSGTPIVDYNVSHPGKTTIRAVAGKLAPNWQVASALYSTNDMIITPYDALADFGIVGDGITDVTDEIQDALVVIANLGGGSLFLPEGFYRVEGNLTVPSSVTLRGDWKKPEPGQPVVGTVLMAYAGRDNENAPYFITLSGSGGVNGMAVWYPEQLPNDIRPYPITFGNGGAATIENITLVNAYFGYSSYRNGTTGRPFVRNIYGTPLKAGIEFDCIADIGRIETVHFSPAYWAGSGLANAPTGGEHEAWLYNNGTGIVLRRLDWSYSCYATIEGYHIGVALRPSRWDGKVPNGQSYGFNLIDCKYGVYDEASAYAGYQMTRFHIEGAETGVYISPSHAESVMMHTCTIEASDVAVLCEAADGRLFMTSCNFRQGAVRMDGGYLSVINSDLVNAGAHIELTEHTKGATLLGNRFADGVRIVDNTDYPVEIDHAPLGIDPLPPYDYKKPETAYTPSATNLYVVTAAPFNAQANGVADDTAAFSNALSAAELNGGGTVFVPAGNYRLDGTLTVPTGVELRGVFDIPHGTDTKGSLLNIYSGHNESNGVPFIQLEAGSGIKGLNFHYPNQIYDGSKTNTNETLGFVPYPFMIRGLGPDVYVVNISATIPYELLDLATERCDRHYVDYIFSTCLKTGIHIGGGSADGNLHNIQFNPNSYTARQNEYESIPSDTAPLLHLLMKRDATPFLFGNMTNQVVHECFVFSGARGMHLVGEGGHGPSGHCLGMGVDAAIHAYQIDDVGDADFQPINSQIVATDGVKGRYLVTGPSLADTFKMFSSAGWGVHEYSAVIQGGDVHLQNFHLARDGERGAFKIQNGATLASYAGNLDDYLAAGKPFLTIDPTATASFVGNIINTTEAQMPDDAESNVTALSNLRFGAPASEPSSEWTNGGGDRAWNSGFNWDNGIPGAFVRASVALPGPIVGTGTSASAGTLVVDDTLDVTGGALSVTDWLALGYDSGNHGALNITAGNVSVGSVLYVGLNGTGNVQLDGGSLAVGSLVMTGGGLLDIVEGTLVIVGDATATVGTYVSNGWITAYGGAFVADVYYDNTNTTVTAVEPPLTTTVWNPGAGSNGWTTDASWTKGIAPLEQIRNYKVVFNIEGAQECVLGTNAIAAQLAMGDNGTTNGTFLRLAAGAELTAGLTAGGGKNWTGIGYNRNARLTVEAGAILTAADHLWIGNYPPGIGMLEIDGGTVNVNGQLGLGWNSGTGFINLRRGTLNLDRMDASRSIGADSAMDIEAGTLTIQGNHTNTVNGYVAAGRITAYGGAGMLLVDYNGSQAGKTTVTATAPASGYTAWAAGWGVDLGAETNDYDNDGLLNVYEYGLGGVPTSSASLGYEPTYGSVADGGTNLFQFVHVKLTDENSGITYLVEATDDLVYSPWTNLNVVIVGSGPFPPGFETVTNRVPTAGKANQFMRLIIE